MATLLKSKMSRKISGIPEKLVRSYIRYWYQLTPATIEERYNRWLFAFLSVKTGWQQNVDSYKAITTIPWSSKAELREILEATNCGCYTAKVDGIWNFHDLYVNGRLTHALEHPRVTGWTAPVTKGARRPPRWPEWRDHLVSLAGEIHKRHLHQAGLKVVSFAHELCWPTKVQVVAIDTHVAKWYGLAKEDDLGKHYRAIEEHWLTTCARVGYPPDIVRHILWDIDQKQPDTRYWAHVFERKVPGAAS